MSKLFPKIIKGMPGCEIIEQNIQEEHIHMLMVIPPKYAVSDVIGEIKQYTASKIRKISKPSEVLKEPEVDAALQDDP